MDDDMINAGELELGRRFDAYARARLSPSPQAVARIRARVMREARLQHDAARIAAHVAPAIAARRPVVRRLAMPLLAAGVWLALGVGTIAAAQAGGPLYPTRLWIETATLPSADGPRVEADLGRLDDRIAEALGAANRGDHEGVAAALDAYASIADDATLTSGADATLEARVEQALARHQAVLTALAAGLSGSGNDTAAAAIETNLLRAIDHNAAVLARLAAHQGGPATPTGAGGGGGGSGNPAAGGSGTGSGTGTTGGAGTGSSGGSGAGGSGAAGGQSGDNGGGSGAGSATGGTQGGSGPDKPKPTPRPTPDHDPQNQK
jgi:hypothetical protein